MACPGPRGYLAGELATASVETKQIAMGFNSNLRTNRKLGVGDRVITQSGMLESATPCRPDKLLMLIKTR